MISRKMFFQKINFITICTFCGYFDFSVVQNPVLKRHHSDLFHAINILTCVKKTSIQTWGFLTIFRLGVWLWWDDGDISYAFNYDVLLGLCALGVCKLRLCNFKNQYGKSWLIVVRLKTLNFKKASRLQMHMAMAAKGFIFSEGIFH